MAGAWVTSVEANFSLIVNGMLGVRTGTINEVVSKYTMLYYNLSSLKWETQQSGMNLNQNRIGIARESGLPFEVISI